MREPGVRGTCAERQGEDQPVRLRLRKRALLPGAVVANPLDVDRIDDPRQGVALVGVFGAFGGFGFLGGAILVASTLERRRSAPQAAVSPLRNQLAGGLNMAANGRLTFSTVLFFVLIGGGFALAGASLRLLA